MFLKSNIVFRKGAPMTERGTPGITIVVAMDQNRVIGREGDIPWRGRLRADMDHFKKYTMGKIVVMGRKTYDSIPPAFRPLVGRENIVLTRNQSIDFPGCGKVSDPDSIERIAEAREICVIGGAEIYSLFLPVAKKMIVTHVGTRVQDGDTFIPEVDGDLWRFSKQLLVHDIDERNHFPFSISEYVRR